MDSQPQWLPPTPAIQSPLGPTAPTYEEPRPPYEEPRKPLLKRILGPLIVAGILVFKFAAKLKGLLLLLPKIKVLSTAGSMLVSVAAYSLIWGLKFADSTPVPMPGQRVWSTSS